jgi:2-oxoglutarate dehydrogenase E2 component (dihydrolipoamide succinyltransferase)
MTLELKVPESGESISEVEVGRWHKAEGDRVEHDEVLVELETDKATFELPSPASGTLERILKHAGEAAAIGEVIGVIKEDGAPQAKQPKAGAGPDDAIGRERLRPEKETVPPRAQQPAPDAASREHTSSRAPEMDIESQPHVMPAAHRLLSENDLSPSDVRGTGPGGRVLKEDVLHHLEERAAAKLPQNAEPHPPAREPREEKVVRMTLIRRRIAKRLVDAQQRAALLTTFNEIDMSGVLALRRDYRDKFEAAHAARLGFVSFFVKSTVDALKRYPALNAEVRDEDIVYRNYYDIGIAVATDRGLVVPVLRDADALSFAEIEQNVADFAHRARENKLHVRELEGGTFTVSNGGVYGSLLSTPIVNPPQSGILGLHAIQDRPIALDGVVVIRPMMYVALTYDHRIVDGREAVFFLKRIRECIEEPARLILEM